MAADRRSSARLSEGKCGAASVMGLERHAILKNEILELLAGLADLLCSNRTMCRELSAKLSGERFNLIAVGEFKRGKSSLINALLGEELLPTGVTPVTSVGVVVRHGDKARTEVRFLDGRSHCIGRDRMAEYVTESCNPSNGKRVKEVSIEISVPLLKNGVQLIDTPGIGSIHRHNTETAYTLLPQCDAALFVLSADQPLGRGELDFLADVRRYAHRIFFILNKIDYLEDERELQQSLAYTSQILSETFGVPVRLFPLSARRAIRQFTSVDSEIQSESGLQNLQRELERFLIEEKGNLLVAGTLTCCERLMSASRLELEIALQSLAATPAELQAKLESFRTRRTRLNAARSRLAEEFGYRLERGFASCLDADLPKWKKRVAESVGVRFDEFASEKFQLLSPRALDEILAEFITEDLAKALTPIRLEVEQRLFSEFKVLARTFWAGMEALARELQEFAADLFQLKNVAPSLAPAWRLEPKRQPDWGGDLGLVELLSELSLAECPAWFTRRFPRIEAAYRNWSKRRVVVARRRSLEDSVETSFGRLRYYLLRQLEMAGSDHCLQAFGWYDSSAAGIELALETGLTDGQKAADFRAWRLRTLKQQLDRLKVYEERLDAIRRATVLG